MAGPKASYAGDDATAIGNAFRTFVKVHQDLLNVIIGKAGFLTQIPFVGPPVTAVLRGIESVVDVSFSFFLCIPLNVFCYGPGIWRRGRGPRRW